MTLNFEKYERKLTRYFEDTVEAKGIDVKVLTDGIVNVLNQLKIRDYGEKNSNVISVKDGAGKEFKWNKDTGIMYFYGSTRDDYGPTNKELEYYMLNSKSFIGCTGGTLKFNSPMRFYPPNALGSAYGGSCCYEIYFNISKDVRVLLEMILSNQSSRQGDLLGLDS